MLSEWDLSICSKSWHLLSFAWSCLYTYIYVSFTHFQGHQRDWKQDWSCVFLFWRHAGQGVAYICCFCFKSKSALQAMSFSFFLFLVFFYFFILIPYPHHPSTAIYRSVLICYCVILFCYIVHYRNKTAVLSRSSTAPQSALASEEDHTYNREQQLINMWFNFLFLQFQSKCHNVMK